MNGRVAEGECLRMKFEKVILISLCLALIPLTKGLTKSDRSFKPTPMINVAAVGDIMMGTDYPLLKLPENQGMALFNESKEILRKANIAFGNLEGTLYEGGSPGKDIKEDETFFFRTPPKFVNNLADAGFNVLSLANNHTGDFGREGLTSTKETLKSVKIRYSSKAGEVAEFEVKGVKIGLVALSFGPPPRSIVNPEKVLGEIGLLSKKYDLLILSIHGGKEGRPALQTKNEYEYFLGKPRGNLVEFTHQAIVRGADLILGHGPHVPRAMEVYQKRLVAYSLGNFCTYGGMNLKEERSYAPLLWVELDRNGEFIKGKIYSFIQIPPGGPKKDEQGRAYGLIKKLSQQDFPRTYPPLDPQR
jgi:poly-gamma-glutamate capsule biosynthesis protein CapA/YwtB (metallophosphatase superfamily)